MKKTIALILFLCVPNILYAPGVISAGLWVFSGTGYLVALSTWCGSVLHRESVREAVERHRRLPRRNSQEQHLILAPPPILVNESHPQQHLADLAQPF